LIIDYLLFITCYLLFVIYYLLFIIYYLLFVICCPMAFDRHRVGGVVGRVEKSIEIGLLTNDY